MTAGDEGPDIVEKVMSINRTEFEAGLKRLAEMALPVTGEDGYVLINVGAERQAVRCTFETLPSAVLGHLLQLPRARIRLDLTALSADARKDFIDRFDLRFQRGGG